MLNVTERPPTPTTTAIRARLFVSSYAPLFLLLALRFDDAPLRLTALACGVVGLLEAIRLVEWQPRRVGRSPYTVSEVRDHGSHVAGYLVTYLLPFLPITDPSAADLVACLLFMCIVGVIFVRSDMAEINPTLYLLGRRVLQIRTSEGWSGFAVVRGLLQPGDILRAVHLDQAFSSRCADEPGSALEARPDERRCVGRHHSSSPAARARRCTGTRWSSKLASAKAYARCAGGRSRVFSP